MKPIAGRLVIPEPLRARQTRASDPAYSIWVSANAGSGKTHVLTQRVIRLLLNGVAPSKVLCLTFTKAAAAQMSERVFDTLAKWTSLHDADLRIAIAATGAPTPTATELVVARRLFTRAVETPGGLKIQTIHAFCERLLHLFPFEANVPARFEVAEERRADEMLAAARRETIEAAQRSAGPLGVGLALVADVAGAFGIDKVIREAIAHRAASRRYGIDLQHSLRERLGGDARFDSVAAVRTAVIAEGIAPSRWPAIAAVFAAGSASDIAQARRLRDAIAFAQEGAALAQAVSAYVSVFFGAEGPRSRLLTKAVATACPGLKEALHTEQDRLCRLVNELNVAETVERTAALLALVDETVTRYERAKIANGLLDFDDLIERTLALLRRSNAGWVLHKLDSGIDHVLVDEAQDTSEAQWKILEHLTGDFATGSGARGSDRSFFVVGDDKQSIFSFQGAAPLMFDQMRHAFERRFRSGAKPFERVTLNTSFRSVPGILAAIDHVFAPPLHQDGLVQPADVWPTHESIKPHLPGRVEIWPRVKAEPTPDPADWTIPVDTPSDRDPPSIVAERVAKKIAHMLAPQTCAYVYDKHGSERRPMRPGDILILVRTRNAFFEAVIRALKRHRVDVAGADRLDVANHIAVMDLVAAGRASLLRSDDLNVACVLKSPLFGLTDDDLIALAPGRTGPLFDALATSADERHRRAHAVLSTWAARAAGTTPFAFYIELLGRDGGRRRMEERLGPEAHDAIDEFLRLALQHEQQGAPSLGAFLADVEALETSVKRDMDGPGDFVRVMTVHAAKGLEAKVVFLPDTCGVPAPVFDPVVFDLAKGTGRPPVLAWSPRKADDPEVVAMAREMERKATMREYRRLLYVALTRAEERLYIAGFHGSREPPSDCWNAMVDAVFATEGEDVPAFWSETETVRRIESRGSGAAARPGPSPLDQRLFDIKPPWLSMSLAPRPVSGRLRPSRAGAKTPAAERKDGMVYGTAMHELLQHLPARPPLDRAKIGRTFLRRRGAGVPAYMHEQVLADALGVIAHPALAVLFGPDAKAEVAATGRIAAPGGHTRDVVGKIDRMVVTDDEVIIADFKTGRPTAEVPVTYREQLALYRRVLMPLWPGRRFRTLLVWTRGPLVLELDSVDLDAAIGEALALP